MNYFWETCPGCAQHTPTAEEPPSKKPMFRSRDHFVAKRPSAIVSIWVFVPSCPDPVWCHRLSLHPFNSKRMRTPPLPWAPWLQISDTVGLSAVIGPVLLFVKMCVWLYQIPPPRKSINFQACLQGHTHHKNDLCEHLFFEITSTRQPHRRPNFRPNQRCNK